MTNDRAADYQQQAHIRIQYVRLWIIRHGGVA